MTDHWKDCWENENHPLCRLMEIRRLQAENNSLRSDILTIMTQDAQKMGLYDTQPTQSAGQCTHTAFTPMTHHGPTWGAPCDDPPSYTP